MRTTNISKVKICFYTVMFIFVLFIGHVLTKEDITHSQKPITDVNLSKTEMHEDFDFLFKTIEKNVPMIEKYFELYEVDINKKREKYHELIEYAENDFDFFCIVHSFLEEFPSCHTKLCFPISNNYNTNTINGNCINEEVKAYADYWYKTIGNEVNENANTSNVYWFNYVDGKYCSYKPSCYHFDDTYINDELELYSINGVNVLDYIRENPSGHRLAYDFKNDVSYRNYIILNEAGVGEKVKVQFVNNENYIEKDMYIGIESDVVYGYSYLYRANENMQSVRENIYFYRDEKSKTEYISIRNFQNQDGLELVNEIREIPDNYNVILDLRGNSGGYLSYPQNYIYPFLFNNSTENVRMWYANKNNKYLDSYDKEEYSKKYDLFQRKTYYEGKTQKKYDVYVLTNGSTASAADDFTALLKDNGLAYVIGDNTMGEGLAGTYCSEVLPNSRLVFYFMPGMAHNADGTDNSTYGTSPTIYAIQTIEAYRKFENFHVDGEDPYTYENRLKWDNVLIETLEIIKEKENTK